MILLRMSENAVELCCVVGKGHVKKSYLSGFGLVCANGLMDHTHREPRQETMARENFVHWKRETVGDHHCSIALERGVDAEHLGHTIS